ncbi:CocE/NonD family hydrolase [Propionispira raffinosivorans]|uniref:CocE/NonD family hydrolase n=1 Tax=Propionispira raffinosivorans TaxID=86959 RepID=UPI0003630A4D|nr:CocE/NonD family hydrolase [Propionispira raffinosivorans]
MSTNFESKIIYRLGASLDAPQSRYPGFAPGRSIIKAGSVIKKGAASIVQDLVFDRDVAVTLRDGVRIYADIYRPANIEEPIPAIIAWSPYGKHDGYINFEDFPYRAGVPQRKLSGLEKFEAPDPNWWCPRGYAIVNPDIRGAYKSEGKMAIWDRQEGEDGADLIEWIASQEWCNGKIGTAGTSWLGVGQWFIAAERPPHLAAIAPWEGMGDVYRFCFGDGGIPDAAFISWLMKNTPSETCIEDIVAMVDLHPDFNAYWARKRAAVEQIDVPVYANMSWGGKLHGMGFFDAWHRLTTKDSWLRLACDLEWPGFYDNKHQEDLRRFFDYFLKGQENGWRATPPVRLTVVDFANNDIIDRPEREFPIARAMPIDFFLNAENLSLQETCPETATVKYDAETGESHFDFTFAKVVELNGYPELHLFVEAEGSDDADIFVRLTKLSSKGEPQGRILIPKEEPEYNAIWDEVEVFTTGVGRSLYCYDGPWGRIRASRRGFITNPREIPKYNSAEERLSPGEVAEIKLTLAPTAMMIHPGETLRLTISGKNLVAWQLPGGANPVALRNQGKHVLHTGGARPSRVILPIIADHFSKILGK